MKDQASQATPKSKPKPKPAQDLKPKQDPSGGIGLLLPAVQKVREVGPRG